MNPEQKESSSTIRLRRLVNSVTFDDLAQAIRNAIQAERIGVPVSVRLHWEFEEAPVDLRAVADSAIALADAALKFDEPVWRERPQETGKTLNLLGSDKRGRTALLTLVAASEPSISLTVYGNHGVVRLEDAVLDRATIPESD